MRLKGWIKVIVGGLLTLLAGLAVVGSVVSGRVVSLIIMLPLLAAAVALVVSGRRGIYTATTASPTVDTSSMWQEDDECLCPSCGACDLPDAANCCQYCGSKLG